MVFGCYVVHCVHKVHSVHNVHSVHSVHSVHNLYSVLSVHSVRSVHNIYKIYCEFYICVSMFHKSRIYNKLTGCKSGCIVFINNCSYALHVSDEKGVRNM